MALKPKFTVKVDEPKWLQMIRDKQRPVATAAVQALRDVAADAVQEGRTDIAAAGSGFTHAKWLSGLQYKSIDYKTQGGDPSLEAKAIIFHTYGIAGVFESGATIHGKPLMWLPTTPGSPRISKSRKKLVFATVRGVPMAFNVADKARDRKPLYVGVPQVTIPKKFHIVDIVKANFAKLGAAFVREFKDN
jgi:hypothetical protein